MLLVASALPAASGVLEVAPSGERFERQRIRGSLFEPGARIIAAHANAQDDVASTTEFLQVDRPRSIPQPGHLAPLIEATALRHAAHPALRAANLSLVEWSRLFRANIEIESGYRIGAISPVGAIGLGQLMPGTAALLGVDPHDPAENLDGSARYLLMMLERFGSAELALAAYNAGPEAVETHGGIPPFRETQGHVEKVMAVFNRLYELQTSERNP